MDYRDTSENRARLEAFQKSLQDQQYQLEYQKGFNEAFRLCSTLNYIQNYRIPKRLLSLSQQRFNGISTVVFSVDNKIALNRRFAFEITTYTYNGTPYFNYCDPVDKISVPVLKGGGPQATITVPLKLEGQDVYSFFDMAGTDIPKITHISGIDIFDPLFSSKFDSILFNLVNTIVAGNYSPQRMLQKVQDKERSDEEARNRHAAAKIDTRSDLERFFYGPPARFHDGTILRKPDGSIVSHNDRYKYYDGTAGFMDNPNLYDKDGNWRG